MVRKIKSKTHPTHYLMHKYWGRKAHNLIAEYIKHYTDPNDIVLDPFMGSGGVIIESKKMGRKSVGVDINPITRLIVGNTIEDVSPDLFIAKLPKLVSNFPPEIKALSLTLCPDCNKPCILKNAVWDNDVIARVKGKCGTHGQFVKDADNYDRKKIANSKKLLKLYVERGGIYYPNDRVFDFVRRNGKKNINELFSERNILQAAILLRDINRIRDSKVRDLYKMAFTSMLPNVSSMIPANAEQVTGKSGWQISKFWVPKCHTEKNLIESFESRAKLIYKGKLETLSSFSSAEHSIHIQSAERLNFIADSSVDYIFTDPPYGDSIAYLALSMFWNSWLKYDVDYDAEIIHDPYRKKDVNDYKERLDSVFAEMYRVLKPGKYLSFTFHNRHLKFWKIIIDTVLDSGFELKNVAWHAQAASSGTQGINRRNTLRGDFVYTFTKPGSSSLETAVPDIAGESLILQDVSRLFKKYRFIETSKLYEKIIPTLVTNRAFLDSNGKVIDIDKILAEKFRYIKVKHEDKWRYGWAQK